MIVYSRAAIRIHQVEAHHTSFAEEQGYASARHSEVEYGHVALKRLRESNRSVDMSHFMLSLSCEEIHEQKKVRYGPVGLWGC